MNGHKTGYIFQNKMQLTEKSHQIAVSIIM